ncbi:NAD(P)-dependent dehydrogenase, short-chain alcohol dehydrogenase family [Fodinibius salinus]|uniref:NAD(P)-dependent dehydrogenase, short-chain alcohol dehydrogenase family n=1 Tax=Fodinibius salinus TaxID=860790 RepID=A0A5D3YIA4_9BACT|nr:SDR family oxidoreductase [Fodinibius salinus]TYP92034.1 NAD(P)-dependent dehydrogenase, short-chain alcohol dehydrogenase family [Fodinibius salinus]
MDLTNKLCVVTGANSGIGKETARAFAQQEAYVVMICRNEQRARTAKKEIINSTGHTGIEIVLADLTVQQDVRQAADQIIQQFDRVDILVNNAGIIPDDRQETVDGIEKTLAINHLAPFLLTNLLLDHLQKAEQGRIVNVSSEVHRVGASIFDLDNIQLKDNYTPMKAYGLSKLCNIMFTHQLAKRTTDTSITANCLHPGVVNTQLAEEANWIMKFFYWIGKPFMKSPQSGAETIIYLSTSDEVRDISGKYFKNQKEASPASIAYDDVISEKLWEQSEELTDLS